MFMKGEIRLLKRLIKAVRLIVEVIINKLKRHYIASKNKQSSLNSIDCKELIVYSKLDKVIEKVDEGREINSLGGNK